MKKALIIYPHDDSSSFLLKPFHFLQNKFKSLTYYEVFPNDDSHLTCLSLIKKFDNIVFMGHGSHVSLCGARTSEYNKQDFLSYKVINELERKTWLFFSCNSCDLIKRCSNINAIGFGNLPTSTGEIQGAREIDIDAYKGVTSEVIELFKKSINWIIVESVTSLINENLSTQDLYNRCSLLITKRMVDSLNNPSDPEQRALVDLLFEMKLELSFIKQKV